MKKEMLEDDYNESFDDCVFPSTRYQGSKLKIIDWIICNLEGIEYDSVLDIFGGTGVFSYEMKKLQKTVYYNDYLKFNHIIGTALIENKNILLSDDEVNKLFVRPDEYPKFIQENYKDIFYYDEENDWLDYVSYNIRNLDCKYKQSMAYFALFQSCIAKRPYNLFHRANLNMRSNVVKRSFGNKTTWDKAFEEHFRKYISEANRAVFDNEKNCKSYNYSAMDYPIENSIPDLVYMDPPYINAKGVGTDYLDFYSFIEGLVDYDNWIDRIDEKYKHKTLIGKNKNPWTRKDEILYEFDRTIEKYSNSIIVISYRNDGIPTKDEIISILKKYGKQVIDVDKEYQYALSKSVSKEMLLIGL